MLFTALAQGVEGLDLPGTALVACVRNVTEEALIVERCGAPVDWQSSVEQQGPPRRCTQQALGQARRLPLRLALRLHCSCAHKARQRVIGSDAGGRRWGPRNWSP
jgi:hypothetical protein